MMRVVIAALAVVAVAVAVLAASVQKARAAFPLAPKELPRLEAELREAPEDEAKRAALVQAYLEAKAPGAAAGLVHEALKKARATTAGPSAELLHSAANVEFHMGRTSKALPLAEEAKARCEGIERSQLCTEIERRVLLLRELVKLGVEDPIADPEHSALAHQRAGRAVTFGTSAAPGAETP